MKRNVVRIIIIGTSLLLTLSCYGQNKETDTNIDSIQALGELFEDNGFIGGTVISKSFFRTLISPDATPGTNAIKDNCEQKVGIIQSGNAWSGAGYYIVILQGKTLLAAKAVFAKLKDNDTEINGKFIIIFHASSPEYATKIKEVFLKLKSDEHGNLRL